MSRKLLLSFLGTGAVIKDPKSGKETNKREYRTANYCIEDKRYSRSFVADALTDHYGIDTIFLIGTVRSMWEEVYRSFSEKHQISLDEECYLELADTAEKAGSDSSLSIPHKEKIEEVLGNDSKVILIKYGLNEEELNYNISVILGIERYLRNGDELYIDITHSFRSLPLMLMNILIYLQNVSRKRISIKCITYGMLDVSNELGYTPVVDVKKVMEVNEWISGAYSFSEFGNAYKISKLLEAVDKNTSKRLADFTNAKNINNMVALQSSVQQLRGINFDNLPAIARMTITPVVEEFIRAIGTFRTTSEFQFRLAKWQRDKHNYYAAYLTLIEAIVSYVCEEEYENYGGYNPLNITDKATRENAKKVLTDTHNYPDIRYIYFKVCKTRNSLAHALKVKSNNEAIKKSLNDAFNKLEPIIIN